MNSRVSNLYLGNPNENATNENLAVSTAAVSLAALHADTDYVVLDIQDNNMWVTFDGTTPSASNGHLLVKEQGLIVLSATAAKAAQFIRVSADGVVHATQFVD